MFKNWLQKLGINEWKNNFKVSAIVLCYNGQPFIEQRLQSIIDQTYKPYEIIFLDDASTDGSVNLGTSILKEAKIKHKLIVNKTNMGIAYQALKAFKESAGDYIWLAEQDDFCCNNFLVTLKEMFEKDAITMAYCNSTAVDENLQPMESYYNNVMISNHRESFCIPGTTAVIHNLCIQNNIPSVSGVIFKKSALKGIDTEFKRFKIFFDWIIYVYVLRAGKVSYCNEKLNYHRRHKESVIGKKGKSVAYYEDIINIKEYIVKNYVLPENLLNPLLFQVDHVFRENGCEDFESKEILEHIVLGPMYLKLQRNLNQLRINSLN